MEQWLWWFAFTVLWIWSQDQLQKKTSHRGYLEGYSKAIAKVNEDLKTTHPATEVSCSPEEVFKDMTLGGWDFVPSNRVPPECQCVEVPNNEEQITLSEIVSIASKVKPVPKLSELRASMKPLTPEREEELRNLPCPLGEVSYEDQILEIAQAGVFIPTDDKDAWKGIADKIKAITPLDMRVKVVFHSTDIEVIAVKCVRDLPYSDQVVFCKGKTGEEFYHA